MGQKTDCGEWTFCHSAWMKHAFAEGKHFWEQTASWGIMSLFSTNHIMSSTCLALRSSGTQRVGCENGCSDNHAHNLLLLLGDPVACRNDIWRHFAQLWTIFLSMNHLLSLNPFCQMWTFVWRVQNLWTNFWLVHKISLQIWTFFSFANLFKKGS